LEFTDIAILRHTYQPDLATQQPVSVRPVPATSQESLPQSTPTTSTFPGESVPAFSGTSSERIAALRSIAILSGSRISDCPYSTHRTAPFYRVKIRIAAGLRRKVIIASRPGPTVAEIYEKLNTRVPRLYILISTYLFVSLSGVRPESLICPRCLPEIKKVASIS